MSKRGKARKKRVERKRQALLSAIQNAPGLHMRALSRKFAVELGALRHLFSKLQDEDLIHHTTWRAKKYYFSTEIDSKFHLWIIAHRNETYREIFSLLLKEIELERSDIASHLEVAKSTLNPHITALIEAEVLSEQGVIRLSDPHTTRDMLKKYKQGRLDKFISAAREIFDAE